MSKYKGMRTYESGAADNIALGQLGSILVTGTSVSVATAPSVYVSLTFLEDTIFDSSDTEGLIPANDTQQANTFISSTGTSSDVGTNGVVTDSVTFPKGITIFGRGEKFKLASGKVLAYIG